MNIDFTKIRQITTAGRREGNLQIGYQIIGEVYSEVARKDIANLVADSQDLKCCKTQDGRLKPTLKRQIIEKYASSFAQEHMDFMIENAFVGFILNNKAGEDPFVMITDFGLPGKSLDDIAKQAEDTYQESRQNKNNGKISITLPDDFEDYQVRTLLYFIQKKFVILSKEDKTLFLLDKEIHDARLELLNRVLKTELGTEA